MNALLWIFQVVIALFLVAGSAWRYTNYEQAAKDVPSMAALSKGMWDAIGALEVVCAVALLMPAVLKFMMGLTPIVATIISVEMLALTALHVKYVGLDPVPQNPAVWTLALAMVSGILAFGRSKKK